MAPKPIPQMYQRIKKFLDSVPDEVFTRQVLSERTEIGRHTIYQFSIDERMKDYVLKDSHRTIFGCPEAVEEYLRLIKKENN